MWFKAPWRFVLADLPVAISVHVVDDPLGCDKDARRWCNESGGFIQPLSIYPRLDRFSVFADDLSQSTHHGRIGEVYRWLSERKVVKHFPFGICNQDCHSDVSVQAVCAWSVASLRSVSDLTYPAE